MLTVHISQTQLNITCKMTWLKNIHYVFINYFTANSFVDHNNASFWDNFWMFFGSCTTTYSITYDIYIYIYEYKLAISIHNHVVCVQSRHVHSLFQSEFSRQCYLVLPLSDSSIFLSSSCLRLLPRLPISTLYLSSNNVLEKAVSTQDVSNPLSLPPFHCM